MVILLNVHGADTVRKDSLKRERLFSATNSAPDLSFPPSLQEMRVWASARPLQSSPRLQWRNLSSPQRPRKQSKVIPSNEELLDILDDIEPDATIASAARSQAADAPLDDSITPSSPLPALQLSQSPLLDPKLNAARFDHKKPKTLPNLKKLSGFQLKLQKNPYGITRPIRRKTTPDMTPANLPLSSRSRKPHKILPPHRRPPAEIFPA